MHEQIDERHTHWLLKGRLVLALVSERAERCPNKRCGRARRCLARFSLRSNYHRKLGDCPNMSEAEWRAVSLGLQANRKFTAPYFRAKKRPKAPEDVLPPGAERLPPEERFRIWTEPWREQARKERWERDLAHPGAEYWELLWYDLEGERLVRPADPVTAERGFLRRAREIPCRCAAERRVDGCGQDGQGCVRAT